MDKDKSLSADGCNEGWATKESWATTGHNFDLKPSTNGEENRNYTVPGISETRKSRDSADSHRTISWGDDLKPNLETGNSDVFQLKPANHRGADVPMPPPLKKRLSSGFSLGLGLPGWSNGSYEDKDAIDNSNYDLSSCHQTPRPSQRFTLRGSFSSLPHSSGWTGMNNFFSDPLIDTPCPTLYYGNLGGYQTPSADLGFRGVGLGAIGGAWNAEVSNGLNRRGSILGASWSGNVYPFQDQDTTFLSTSSYSNTSNQRRSVLEPDPTSVKREHPSEITNVMLDGRIFKVRRVVDCAKHASGNIPCSDNFVTVGVEPYIPRTAHQESFASYFGQKGSDDCKNQKTPLLRASMPTKPSASFDSVSRSINTDTSSGQGCICKRSRCLKLYCKCFQTSKFCDNDACRCKDCRNTNEFDGPGGDRNVAVKSILARRKDAFEIRPTKRSGEGCSCKKNR
jgi:Tesmin/TSO1-like CXC domain, cysteine-rich domain